MVRTQNELIPPEYGRIEAYTTNVTDAENPVRVKLNLTDCRNILEKEEIESSPLSFQKGVETNSTLCLDPKEATPSLCPL